MEAATPEATPESEERRRGAAAVVLVCDSFTERAADTASRLQGLGYEIVVAETSEDAVKLASEKKPDLALVAAQLCDGTGAELCRAFRTTPQPPPVIIMTERGDKNAINEGQSAGADEFLSMPMTPGELSLRVRRVLGLRILKRAIPSGPSSLRSAQMALAGSAPDPSEPTRRILLAEDDEDLRKVVEKLLVRSGYEVCCAANGMLALEELPRFKPELIISDVQMPKMSGIEFCRTMKADPESKEIPFIMVTGLDPAQGAREAYQAGADDYLVKPVHSSELLVRIRTMLRIQALRDRSARDKALRDAAAARGAPPEKGRTDLVEPLDPLRAWFRWCELWQRSPDVRKVRERASTTIDEYLDGLHEYKAEVFSDAKTPPEILRKAYREMRNIITTRVEKLFWEDAECAKTTLPGESREMLIMEILNDRFGFGPVQPLIDDGRITDILVNRFNEVHIEMGGRLIRTPIRFNDEDHLRRIMTVVLRYSGKEINEARPYVETRLRDGSRVSATLPPLSIDGGTLTIRKFVARRMDLNDLLRTGTLSPEMASVLDLFVKAGMNIIVSGATGAGKTTLLNLLGCSIPAEERIITVEDTAELQIRNREVIPELMGRSNSKDQPAQNMERFEARSSPIENLEISIRDIIRLALRKRPDRIIVGEVRGGEALDMLNAMNTGHRGCLTTIHANNVTDMIVRIENMVLEANPALPLGAAQRIIVAALNLAVQVVKFADNRRRITEVTELAGFDAVHGHIQLRQLFVFRAGTPAVFEMVNEPSEKLRGLVEEYLIRTGMYVSDWDRNGTDEEAHAIGRRLFRRHVSVHFPAWTMKGLTMEEKSTLASKIWDRMAEDVWSDSADSGFGGEEEHELLERMNRDARLRVAKRLGLPDELIEILTRPDPPDRATWERIFPKELRSSSKRGDLAQAPVGEGYSEDDIRMAFFSASAASRAISSAAAASRIARIESLKSLMPYLRMEPVQ